MAAAWALVMVLMLTALAGMALAPVLGAAKDGAALHGVSIPRFDPMAIDPPPSDEIQERDWRTPRLDPPSEGLDLSKDDLATIAAVVRGVLHLDSRP